MRVIKYLFFLFFGFLEISVFASGDDYAKATLLYEDHIYNSNIKTVRFYFNGWETGFPAIKLNSDEKIGVNALRVINRRADLLDAGQLLEDAAFDKYSFVRDGYLQRRRNQVYDGNPPPVKEED